NEGSCKEQLSFSQSIHLSAAEVIDSGGSPILKRTTLWQDRRWSPITGSDVDERTNRHDSSPPFCREVDDPKDRQASPHRSAQRRQVSFQAGTKPVASDAHQQTGFVQAHD